MPQGFGARLRQRREEQAIALSAIAEQTKIKLSLLEALERDDVSQWPSGIFRRAFIRAYAHAIGLNPDDVVREFLEVHPDPADALPAVEAIAARADEDRGHAAPPTRLRFIMGSAIGSLARLRRVGGDDEIAAPEPLRVQPQNDLTPPTIPDEEPQPAAAAAVDAAPPAAEPVQIEAPTPPVSPAEPTAASQPSFRLDLAALAQLCTELGRVDNADDLRRLLRAAAGIVDATGLIVWLWDGIASELRPALAYGYSDRVLAQLPPVTPDAENATAAAFRSAQPRAIDGSDRHPGGLALPLLTPSGCGGVLAIELQPGREQMSDVRSAATIFAAMLTQLIGSAESSEDASVTETVEPVPASRYRY
jgi:hypothetical protein